MTVDAATDIASPSRVMRPDAVRNVMRANRRRDTKAELAIRTLLHRRGLRFRVDQPLPFDRRRRADITFTRVGLYVFVDGCFWHGCPDHFVMPKTNSEFWRTKIAQNRSRDLETNVQLAAAEATVLRIWEHEPAGVASDLISRTYESLRQHRLSS